MSGMAIPIECGDHEHFDLFVALDDDTLTRITDHDPFDLRLQQIRNFPPWSHLQLREIIVGYLSPVDKVDVQALIARNATGPEIQKFLSRGYRFHPDRGDGVAARPIPTPDPERPPAT